LFVVVEGVGILIDRVVVIEVFFELVLIDEQLVEVVDILEIMMVLINSVLQWVCKMVDDWLLE